MVLDLCHIVRTPRVEESFLFVATQTTGDGAQNQSNTTETRSSRVDRKSYPENVEAKSRATLQRRII